MKYLKTMNESIETYSFTEEPKYSGTASNTSSKFDVKYRFDDLDGNKYRVLFKNDSIGPKNNPFLGNSYELAYFVWDEEKNKWSVSKIVNSIKGNVYSTLKTIFGEILKDFLETRPWVKSIWLEGLLKDQEVSLQSQRTRAYLRYLKNNPIPGFNVKNLGNKITLIKK